MGTNEYDGATGVTEATENGDLDEQRTARHNDSVNRKDRKVPRRCLPQRHDGTTTVLPRRREGTKGRRRPRGILPSRCVGINADTTTPRQRRVIHRCTQMYTDRDIANPQRLPRAAAAAATGTGVSNLRVKSCAFCAGYL